MKNLTDFLLFLFNNKNLDFYELLIIIALIALFVVFLDWLTIKIISPTIKRITEKSKNIWDDPIYQHKVYRSVVHFFSLSLAYVLVNILIDPSNELIISSTIRILNVLVSLVFIKFSFRVVNALLQISIRERKHESIAVRTFGELIKVITLIIGLILIIAIIFNVSIITIITSLSAVTAILILVFRDTLLGFVAGIQIASSKMIKEKDWIKVPKYNADGEVEEINLVTAKILNFDKTISNIPTYDLITTEVINYDPMLASHRRRIKRSIIFNIKSFKFCDSQMIEKFNKFNLISDYLSEKENKIDFANPDPLKKNQITNIGVFRKYTERYLLRHEKISNEETLLVRQLSPTPNGMPLEIYCFTKTSIWKDYEQIQADVFDHLLTASKYFELEVIQITLNS